MVTLKWAFFALLIISSAQLYQSKNTDWSYLLFVQEWPPTRCLISVSETTGESHRCVIPPDVKGWTIHGLWPQETCTEYPSYCNNSWPFDESKILSLEPQLKTAWPNMFPDEGKTSFWTHEWDKHGTCSVTLPALDSEFKYFNTCLAFYQLYDFYSALMKGGIEPSNSITYTVNQIEKAIQSAFDVVPYVECQNKDGKQVVLQMYICIDKSLKKMDCTCENRSCDREKPVYIPPYPELNP